jgi:predicted Co/Zn/Cd cation transporter (cation efflux family)
MNFITLLILKKFNKNISSLSVDIQIKGWEVDVLYSFGMALAFFVALLLKGTFLSPILPYFDQIIAVIIIVCTLPTLINTVVKSIRNMFLFAPSSNTINTIKKRTEKVITKYPYQTTFYDVTKVGRRLWISVYFRPLETEIITLDLKNATEEIRKELKEEYKDFYVELIAEV